LAACGAIGVCLVLLVVFGLAAYQNHQAGAAKAISAAGSEPGTAASHSLPQGGAAPMPSMPIVVAPVALPPIPPARAGWKRVTIGGHSVELPEGQIGRDAKNHEGENRDAAWWPKEKFYTGAALRFAHLTTDRLTDRLPRRDMAIFHDTPNNLLAFEFQQRQVQGFETDEYILPPGTGPEYARHQYIRIHDQEWLVLNAYARDGMTQADVDHFVKSLRLSPTASASSIAAEASSRLNLGSMLGGLSTAGWKTVSSRSGLCSVSMPQEATFKDDGSNNPQFVEEYRWPADCGPVKAWNQSAEYLIFRISYRGRSSLDDQPRLDYAGHEAYEVVTTRGTVYQVERDVQVNDSVVVTLFARSAGNKLTRPQVDAFLNSLKIASK